MEGVSKHKALRHYVWGEKCDGWSFIEEANLSIKLERMPPGAAEATHYHEQAQQFFFILKGRASFEFEDLVTEINKEEGLLIKAGVKHKICNKNTEDLEFLLCSQPSTNNDRINCE